MLLVKRLLKGAMTLVLIGAILWYLGGIGEVGKLMSRIDPLFI
jgi:hypothetical protein